MKNVILVLLFVGLCLVSPTQTMAKKTRSEKEGIHQSTEHHSKKVINQDSSNVMNADTLINLDRDNTSEGTQGSDNQVSENEKTVISAFAILTFSIFFIGRAIAKRGNSRFTKQNEEDHASWLQQMEELQQKARSSKEQNVNDFKMNIRNQLETLVKEDQITETERYQVLQHLDGVNLSLIKETYAKVVAIANNRIKWREIYEREEVERMIAGEYWHGMSEEQLLLMRGEPTKIESEMLKTKINKFYIYGTKSAGDVFVFNDGKLERFKDR